MLVIWSFMIGLININCMQLADFFFNIIYNAAWTSLSMNQILATGLTCRNILIIHVDSLGWITKTLTEKNPRRSDQFKIITAPVVHLLEMSNNDSIIEHINLFDWRNDINDSFFNDSLSIQVFTKLARHIIEYDCPVSRETQTCA